MHDTFRRLVLAAQRQITPVLIIIVGVGITFASSLVPHRAHAFELLPLQVAAGILPYVIYGMLAWMLRTPEVLRYGLLMLAVHLAAVILQRALIGGGGPLLILIPLLLTGLLLTQWPRALRATRPQARPH